MLKGSLFKLYSIAYDTFLPSFGAVKIFPFCLNMCTIQFFITWCVHVLRSLFSKKLLSLQSSNFNHFLIHITLESCRFFSLLPIQSIAVEKVSLGVSFVYRIANAVTSMYSNIGAVRNVVSTNSYFLHLLNHWRFLTTENEFRKMAWNTAI